MQIEARDSVPAIFWGEKDSIPEKTGIKKLLEFTLKESQLNPLMSLFENSYFEIKILVLFQWIFSHSFLIFEFSNYVIIISSFFYLVATKMNVPSINSLRVAILNTSQGVWLKIIPLAKHNIKRTCSKFSISQWKWIFLNRFRLQIFSVGFLNLQPVHQNLIYER